MYPPPPSPSDADPVESDRFYEWLFRLEREPRLDALLTEVLRFLVESTRASTVLLELFGGRDDNHTRAYGIDVTSPEELREMISWSIVGKALATKRIVETACAIDDARFADADSVRRNEIYAVICVPVVEPGGRIVGVLYLQGRAPFGEAARERMLALSHALANVVDRLRGSEDPATYHRLVDAYALSLVSAAHRRNDFNAAAAARELGIDRKTFYRRTASLAEHQPRDPTSIGHEQVEQGRAPPDPVLLLTLRTLMPKSQGNTEAPDSKLVIAERQFTLRTGRRDSKVVARFWKPVPDDDNFSCDFEIMGLPGTDGTCRGVGIDSIQAFELAQEHAALRLLSSHAYQNGRLTYCASHDLDMPLPDSQRFLVRWDLESRRIALDIRRMGEHQSRFWRGYDGRLRRAAADSKVRPNEMPFILERKLDLRRARKRTDVIIRFRKPFPHRYGHWCGFEIEGLLNKPPARTGMFGIDDIDAVRNSMQLAMTYILMSPAYQRGQLTWLEDYDLGLPVKDEIAPLVRSDLHAKVLAEIIMNPALRLRKRK